MFAGKFGSIKREFSAIVEGKICNFEQEKFDYTYLLENAINIDQPILMDDIKIDTHKKLIQIPVYNDSMEYIILFKNETVATSTPIEPENEVENANFSARKIYR